MRDKPLYLVIDSKFQVKKNNNLFNTQSTYKIIGVGYGKKKEGKRREYWVVIDVYNTEIPTIKLWKSDLEKLYDSELIIEL